MIKLVDLSKSYFQNGKQISVLKDINLTIDEGELVAIIGSSGSGKTTLLNILGILDECTHGHYFLDGELIKNLTDQQAAHSRNNHIGFVFQSFHLINYKTAIENVELPLYYQGIKKEARKKIASEFLEKVGLKDRMNNFPNELSGGQKQRVAIARALVTNPKMILADEPTGALDSQTSKEIIDLFKSIHKKGQTVILVTHEMAIANQCQKIIKIKDGQIIES
jgi:putative ABC transport system ATP-binding protein